MKITLPRNWLFLAVCFVITGYFLIHTIQGSRGYLRMRQLQEEIVLSKQIAEQMRLKKELLQTKVNALSAKSLDLDQLEESALRVLDMAHAEDLMVVD